MTRFLEMRLAREGETLRAARWGMVSLVLGERTLLEWYEDENRRRRDVTWQAEEATVRGHEGVLARGEKRRLAGGLRTRAARAVKRSPAVDFEARAWHCPSANRLFLVEAIHSGRGDIPAGVVESVICHGED
jgi:hypothetical protein